MYKLNIDHLTEVKYENTPQHGLFSGTIETDRVVLVDGNGKYLQVDGNFGTDLKIGLVRTYSASRDEAEIAYKIATTSATTYAAVYCYADVMALQSEFDDVDAFIEYLVDELHLITIKDYENPKYQLAKVTVKTGGTSYKEDTIEVEVPGQAGDTPGVVAVSVSDGACASAEIVLPGLYESLVATQDLTVAGGNEDGKITVTMDAVSGSKASTRSLSVEDDKLEGESEEETEEPIIARRGQEPEESEPETESEPEIESESESEPEVEQEVDAEVEQSSEQPTEQPVVEPEEEPEIEPEEE